MARSFWVRESLLVDLDAEYVNFDFPAQILLRFGIAPLHLISGLGHHFLWRISQESIAFHRLSEIKVPPPFPRPRHHGPFPSV